MHKSVVTAFHILWFVLSAFLLLNLVVGAIVNNYQAAMNEAEEMERKAQAEKDAVKQRDLES